MPRGSPSAEALSSRQVGAFSRDTSVVEAAGFRFAEGSLRLLRSQMPPWMRLVMSTVVCREITARRVNGIHKAEQQIASGYQDLLRLGGPALSGTSPSHITDVVDRAIDQFDAEVSAYIAHFGGTQLGLDADGLADDLFQRYFTEAAPFGRGRDKKHEFPDAAALVSLERYAARMEIALVVASKDEGWADYASSSSRIYCVDSLQKLTELFESSSPDAARLSTLISRELTSNADILTGIKNVMRRRLPEMRWLLPISRDYRYTLRGTVEDIVVQKTHPPSGEVRVWLTGSDRRHCAAEFPVEADVTVNVAMTLQDHYSSGTLAENICEQVQQRVEANVLIHLTGDLFGSTHAKDWDFEVDLADEPFRVEPTLVDSQIWPKIRKTYLAGFDDDEDIPF
jgi:hypothetical protein